MTAWGMGMVLGLGMGLGLGLGLGLMTVLVDVHGDALTHNADRPETPAPTMATRILLGQSELERCINISLVECFSGRIGQNAKWTTIGR